jgi:hypothetical protein
MEVLRQEEDVSLQTELSRLAQENEALRESAKIWIRMYEKRLACSKNGVALGLPLSGIR